MKENSIEEIAEVDEDRAIREIKRELADEDRKEYMSRWFAKDLEILVYYIEKLQKENEELILDNLEYQRMQDIFDKRTYRKKYLEERRKEEPNLLYPDVDEIYRRYYELRKENEELKNNKAIVEKILDKGKGFTLRQTQYIWEHYIPAQKVKDEIKELDERIKNPEKNSYWASYTVGECIGIRRVLQELLERRK